MVGENLVLTHYLPKGQKGSTCVCQNVLPVSGHVFSYCRALEVLHLPIFLSFIIREFLRAVLPLRPFSAYQLESGSE